jgi:hypothetical protein
MGADDTWVINALQGILPEQMLHLLRDQILDPTGAVGTVYGHAVVGTQRAARLLQPVAAPIAERGARALQESPDIVFFGFLLLVLFIGFQLLMMVQRTVAFFTRLAFRAVLWTLLGLALMAVWQRGPEAAAGDVAFVVRRLLVYAGMVKDIWISEYQKYDAQTRAGTLGSAGAGSMGSAGYSRSSR